MKVETESSLRGVLTGEQLGGLRSTESTSDFITFCALGASLWQKKRAQTKPSPLGRTGRVDYREPPSH